MQKIISLFKRDYGEGKRLVFNEVVEGAEWVINGEGIATRKWDGTCCLIRDDKLYKRYDAKQGKTPPEGFIPAQDPDPVTGHWPGWLEVGDGPEDKYFREVWFRGAFNRHSAFFDGAAWRPPIPGTYELCGPKVNGNKERLACHMLIRHGNVQYPDCPRSFDGIKEWLRGNDIEGVVWHHPDGRMVKIKTRDFGLERKNEKQ